MIQYCQVEPPPALWTDDNWTHHETSDDQKRIEAVLMKYVTFDELMGVVTPSGVWMHIGIGNSSLAKEYCAYVARLDGITVVQEEVDTAPKYDNYRVWICNKHALAFQTPERYDVIIDTTPAGHACCKVHLMEYFEYAFSMLKPGGVYLTDKVGLAWARPSSQGMTPDEFGKYLCVFKMSYKFITDFVIEVTHQ